MKEGGNTYHDGKLGQYRRYVAHVFGRAEFHEGGPWIEGCPPGSPLLLRGQRDLNAGSVTCSCRGKGDPSAPKVDTCGGGKRDTITTMMMIRKLRSWGRKLSKTSCIKKGSRNVYLQDRRTLPWVCITHLVGKKVALSRTGRRVPTFMLCRLRREGLFTPSLKKTSGGTFHKCFNLTLREHSGMCQMGGGSFTKAALPAWEKDVQGNGEQAT